jgi:hypothetical protein
VLTNGSRGVAAALMICIVCSPVIAGAQAVSLRIHPQLGDTLHTRLEQQMSVSAEPNDGGREPTKSAVRAATRSVTTSVRIDSRTIVQSSLATSTLVLTIVDSARMRTSDVHGAEQVAAAERMLLGQQLLLQLAVDGSVESARDGRGQPVARELADAMTAMPAVFPRRPVRVGETWMREMPLPSSGPLGARGNGYVNAVFRLDSLTRNKRIAFVSMQGDIRPESETDGVRLTGAINGSMRLDRVRGWMTDSRVTVLIHSVITPPPSAGRSPMRFVTRVTQHLRAMDKR